MRFPDNWRGLWQTCKIRLLWSGAALIYIGFLALVLLAVLVVPGCQSLTTPLQVPNELLVRCPDLTPLDEGTAGEVVWKIVEVAGQYYNCQARLDALIDAVSTRP